MTPLCGNDRLPRPQEVQILECQGKESLSDSIQRFMNTGGGTCFQLMHAVAHWAESGKGTPESIVDALRISKIHPASWIRCVQSKELQIRFMNCIRLRLSSDWRRILGLPEGEDGPIPTGLRLVGSLCIEGVSIETLPLDMAIESDLYLNNLPNLKTIPYDLWHGSELRVIGCPRFEGWKASSLARVRSLENLRSKLGMPDAVQSWTVDDCLTFAQLPPRIETPISLTIRRCPSFKKLPRMQRRRGISNLTLSETLPGVTSLTNLSALVLTLCELPDLEVIRGLGPVDCLRGSLVNLRGLPRLHSVRGFQPQTQLGIQACRDLKHLHLTTDIGSIWLSDLPSLKKISGLFRGETFHAQRCPQLEVIPKFGETVKYIKIMECRNLIRPHTFESTKLLWRNFSRRFDSLPGKPLRSGQDGKTNCVNGSGFQTSIDPHELAKLVNNAPTVFDMVRILARSLVEGAPVNVVIQLLKTRKINPVSLLLDLRYEARIRAIGSLLGLPSNFLAPEQGSLIEDTVLDDLILTRDLLNLENLKIPGGAHLDLHVLPAGLPHGLEVEDSFWISRSEGLRTLPDRLKVGGNLTLIDLPDLEGLSTELQVMGDLIISQAPKLKHWPQVFNTHGSVRIEL